MTFCSEQLEAELLHACLDCVAGRLVPVFGGAIPSTGGYHLVWPKDREGRAPLVSFRAWLKGEIA